MDMLTRVAYVVIALTIVVIVLAVFVVVSRYLSERRQLRIQHMRARMVEAIDGFLAGKVAMPMVARKLRTDREIALGALLTAASALPFDQRPRLRAFITLFEFEKMELAELRDRSDARRASAANRLGFMGGEGAIPALVEALKDDMLDVRLASAHSLARLRASEAVVPILRAFALPAAWPLQRAVEILYEMGEAAVEPLMAFVQHHDTQSTGPALSVAIKTLGMLRAGQAVPMLIDFLGHPDTELRASSAKALGQIANRDSIPLLCRSLSDTAWEVRSTAAQALGELRDRAAIPALSDSLADQAWWVRLNAAEALHRLGGDGLEALRIAAATHSDGFARDISRQILEEYGAIAEREVSL